MLRKSFIAAAAAMFSLNIGVTAVAIEQPSEDWRIDDTANRTADGLKATKLNEALHKASPGARQAYTRLQAAYDNPDDAYQIEWGDHGDCGGINCEGSYSCGGVVSWFEGSDVIVDWLNDDAPDLDFDRKYGNGERIICAQSGTERGCATLQNVEKSLTGFEVYILLRILNNHGCETCGNVPVRLIVDGVNNTCNPSGELTVDILEDSDEGELCWGIC